MSWTKAAALRASFSPLLLQGARGIGGGRCSRALGWARLTALHTEGLLQPDAESGTRITPSVPVPGTDVKLGTGGIGENLWKEVAFERQGMGPGEEGSQGGTPGAPRTPLPAGVRHPWLRALLCVMCPRFLPFQEAPRKR